MLVGVFEDDDYHFLYPFSYTKPVYEIRSGLLTMRERVRECFKSPKYFLLLREELVPLYRWQINIVREIKDSFVNDLKEVDEDLLLINGRLVLNERLLETITSSASPPGNIIGVSENYDIVFLKLTPEVVEAFKIVLLKPFHLELFSPLEENAELIFIEEVSFLKSPLDLLSHLENQIRFDWNIKGYKDNIVISEKAKVSEKATLDASEGPIFIADNAVVDAQCYIRGPTYIGEGSVVRNSYISKSIICEQTSITNSTIEESLIMDNTIVSSNCCIMKAIIGSWCKILSSCCVYGKVIEEYLEDLKGREGVYIADFSTLYPGTRILPKSLINVFSIVRGTIEGEVKAFTFMLEEDKSRTLSENEALTLAQGRMRDVNRYISDYEINLIKSLYKKLTRRR